ncbi:hypothetical protein [Sorangium sp. So ce117]|uniref:hypothetical protein n=1 Tax=Sorangium sp. So ce117 TaxID=3133277 RepID=UPI003F5DF1DF
MPVFLAFLISAVLTSTSLAGPAPLSVTATVEPGITSAQIAAATVTAPGQPAGEVISATATSVLVNVLGHRVDVRMPAVMPVSFEHTLQVRQGQAR